MKALLINTGRRSKTFLANNKKALRWAKLIIACALGLMIVIDIILVRLESRDFPTFSWVVRDHRPTLLWFTFLFGGLVAKIYYNRPISVADKEFTGFAGFMCVAAMLFVLGYNIPSVGFWDELVVILCGGVVAYRIWPQYVPPKISPDEAMRKITERFDKEAVTADTE